MAKHSFLGMVSRNILCLLGSSLTQQMRGHQFILNVELWLEEAGDAVSEAAACLIVVCVHCVGDYVVIALGRAHVVGSV